MFDHHGKKWVGKYMMQSEKTNLSAPAQDNILLILSTWKGWTRTLKINSVQKGRARNQGNLWKGQNRSISPDVEAFLAAVLDKVLVAANPSCLKGLGAMQVYKTIHAMMPFMSSPQKRAARAHQKRDGQRGGTHQHQPENNSGSMTWITLNSRHVDCCVKNQFALVLM